MAILREAECDCCGKKEYERGVGTGWPNWIIVQGVILDGVGSPMFCEECREPIMNFIDTHKQNLAKKE